MTPWTVPWGLDCSLGQSKGLQRARWAGRTLSHLCTVLCGSSTCGSHGQCCDADGGRATAVHTLQIKPAFCHGLHGLAHAWSVCHSKGAGCTASVDSCRHWLTPVLLDCRPCPRSLRSSWRRRSAAARTALGACLWRGAASWCRAAAGQPVEQMA